MPTTARSDREDRGPSKTTVVDVNVFDDGTPTGLVTVIVDGDRTGRDESDAQGVVDGGGNPIDTHVHLHRRGNLEPLSSWRVITVLDMATWSPELVASVQGVAGLTVIRGFGVAVLGGPGEPSVRTA